jgi:hypothetical protein
VLSDANFIGTAVRAGLITRLAIFGFLNPRPATGQVSGGALDGTVTDNSGAIVVSAKGMLRNNMDIVN